MQPWRNSFGCFTPIILQSVKRYSECLYEMDRLTAGIYSIYDANRNARIGLPEGVTLIANMEKRQAPNLSPFLDEISNT